MRAAACSVSRSVEEAAADTEWPGPPVCNYKQTTLQFEKRPPPPPPPPPPRPKSKSTKSTTTTTTSTTTTRARAKRESRT